MTDQRVRRRIAYEGIPTVDGRVIEPHALTWTAQPIPLAVTTVVGSVLIGTATDLVRQEFGPYFAISALLSHAIIGLGPELDVTNTVTEVDRGILWFTSATVRTITLGAKPGWADLTIGADRA